ncbi:MAG: radical SAM protein [Candidatus Aminicenantes bacterium]|nr:MAG: radical SAM protein [Candidatus Aminicenantes bacterium]
MVRSHKLKMASRFIVNRFKKLHPFEIQANMLNECNLKCVYCNCPEVKMIQMTTEQWKKIIRDLRSLGNIRFKFQGGEPTLRRDFRELCEEAQQAGMITAMPSNGILLVARPKLLDYLDELIISLDSPNEETNDLLRGKGAYEAAVRAIDIALERGVRTFVNMVLTRENMNDLEEMLEFCEGRGIRLNAQPMMFERKYFDPRALALALPHAQMRSLNLRLAEWKKQGRGILFSSQVYQKASNWSDYNTLTTSSKENSSCIAGRFYFHIEPNGDVHPCGLHGANFAPKNILKDGLIEALTHAKTHNCGDCLMPYMNERKALFGFKFAALREIVRRS